MGIPLSERDTLVRVWYMCGMWVHAGLVPNLFHPTTDLLRSRPVP